ncbi:MAG: helicase-related protein [Candidatus Binatia bacterium]
MRTVTPEYVRELVTFAATPDAERAGFGQTQLDGTVALYNMLARNRCAYLADEVGMGKTYVALGVMSLLRYLDPEARIVVIAPRENIQRKWEKELGNFVRNNWRGVDNRVKSLQQTPAWPPVICENLFQFAHEASLNADRDFILRMTSFSLAMKEEESRARYRKLLREHIPWLPGEALNGRTFETFRDQIGSAVNAAVPEIDLLVVDEAHNLKHGFGDRVSIRNRVMAFTFGHPAGRSSDRPWYGPRVKRLLFLSATPFEEEYGAVHRQLEIFGFGSAELRDAEGNDPLPVASLSSDDVPADEKRRVLSRLMVRRVSGLTIAGQTWTKNMYRREWRAGGYRIHDEPIRIDDPRERLVVALMQKKVAEVLRDERFKNCFQIGMLSSFESFLESFSRERKKKALLEKRAIHESEETEDGTVVTDDGQNATDDERKGIDTDAVAEVVRSYRERFGRALPHPKLDATARSLEGCFETGEKTLVFVRRVATVEELAARLDGVFDEWIRARMEAELPGLQDEIAKLFERYARERSRRPGEALDVVDTDELEGDAAELAHDHRFGEDDDEGGVETFFSWFFRGKKVPNVLSGAAFQKNRLSGISSTYVTIFEDDHVAWLLDYPPDVVSTLATALGREREAVVDELRARAYAEFDRSTKRKEGYPRLYVFEAYQVAALEMLSRLATELGTEARIVLEKRYHGGGAEAADAPAGFPGPQGFLGGTTFFTELAKRPSLRARLWPEEEPGDFLASFLRREQRRELLSAMARLGAAYIDLYLLAIKQLGSFSLGGEGDAEALARDFVDLLEWQSTEPGFHAFYELSHAADTFDLLVATNFPQVPGADLSELAAIYGEALQRQVPVGRMSGGVSKRLVRQFRMPGFPLVLVTTNVLQEGEDLHTFCHRVVHYGITWTPSAMEQRTGRVDRIGSLVARRLDGSPEEPAPEQWIQVYYPHLQDTVEVLQVRRVLQRLNKFLELIHRNQAPAESYGSRIDALREALEEIVPVPPITGQLESAFPVNEDWLRGNLDAADVEKPDVESWLRHFDALWAELSRRYRMDAAPSIDRRKREAYVHLREGNLLAAHIGDIVPDTQHFTLELCSQAAGSATFLHCASEVGDLGLRDDDIVDQLHQMQFDLRNAKVCVRPDARHQEDLVTIEGGILFDPSTTQLDEVEALVRRTCVAAATIRKEMISEEPDLSPHRKRRKRRALAARAAG